MQSSEILGAVAKASALVPVGMLGMGVIATLDQAVNSLYGSGIVVAINTYIVPLPEVAALCWGASLAFKLAQHHYARQEQKTAAAAEALKHFDTNPQMQSIQYTAGSAELSLAEKGEMVEDTDLADELLQVVTTQAFYGSHFLSGHPTAGSSHIDKMMAAVKKNQQTHNEAAKNNKSFRITFG